MAEPSAAHTELRALLAQEAVHDPPWHVDDDDGQPFIRGKRGPGWYDNVADEVSNEETANLIVGAVNALPGLLDEIERLRQQVNSGRAGREVAEGLPGGTLPRV
jgi:uncharacterized small protein (DUF1192 family)